MFIEPTITWVPSGFSGYIWLDTKIVLKKILCKLKKESKSITNYTLENYLINESLFDRFTGLEKSRVKKICLTRIGPQVVNKKTTVRLMKMRIEMQFVLDEIIDYKFIYLFIFISEHSVNNCVTILMNLE